MSLLDLLRTAVRSVSANKLRAALTMLGVVIGVASVIAISQRQGDVLPGR